MGTQVTLSDGPAHGPARTGTHVEALKAAIVDNLCYEGGRSPKYASKLDVYMAVAHVVRDRIMTRWMNTFETAIKNPPRTIAYLSAEFLLGPLLATNLLNLDLDQSMREALHELGVSLDDIVEKEEEPGLGNGGLGRLAACYLDSLSTLDIPSVGFGIRYEFGIFDQEIHDGWQKETTDRWLRWGNPWEIRRPESAVKVKFGGHTESWTDDHGRYRVRWVPNYTVDGIPYDTPILGYRTPTAINLRLWASESSNVFDFELFNSGDYLGAVSAKVESENISKVLYPNDQNLQGKQLRLEQQHFFVSCSLQDMIRVHLRCGRPIHEFHQKWAIQLNDTHPAISVAELMRLLIDEHHLGWEDAWDITSQTFHYTNHTLLPEALERWPLGLFANLLPRHMQIIYEINQRFLDEVRANHAPDNDRIARLSIIDETGERYVRMANLAAVGSRKINGVAALHTELLKTSVLRDFYDLYPDRFVNVTNGVTPRRWIAVSDASMAECITGKVGDGWLKDMDELRQLENYANDSAFHEVWEKGQRNAKARLADYAREKTGVAVDPDSLFDVQVKRIHEYKRQHLNVLHILTQYYRFKKDPNSNVVPRTFLFGGKAAPAYYMAKLIIKLINSVAEVVNGDPDMKGRLRVVFLPDYNVKLGQKVYPAADLSEQISTAGKEASGTGNMKFAMNGALTIGTLDGANVELRDEVGAENFFLFGLRADQVSATKAAGYRPWEYYESNPFLREVMDGLSSGHFSHGDRDLFRPLVDSLLHQDEYLLLADYQSYIDSQDRVSEAWLDHRQWTRMSILNTARSGKFSSDRSIREYCQNIWGIAIPR
jgi:starch phosphorylase